MERIFSVKHIMATVECECGNQAKRVISNHGAVHTDGDVKWLASAAKVLQPDSERKIETRSDWKRYLRRNKLECCG